MAKATPQLNNFSGGEFSELVQGRNDFDRYPSASRLSKNCISPPQGPSLGRSGTQYVTHGFSQDISKPSKMIPYTLIDDDGIHLEFSENAMRIISNTDGIRIFNAYVITQVVTGGPLKIRSPTAVAFPGFVAGIQVALFGLGSGYNVEGRVLNVLSVVGNDFTLNISTTGPDAYVPPGATVHIVFKLVTPYTAVEAATLRWVQDNDDIYLFCQGKRNYKIHRIAPADWTIAEVAYDSGPFISRDLRGQGLLTLSGSGNALPPMTGATAPSGEASASSAVATHEAWKAFDDNQLTYWEPTTDQKGSLRYEFPTSKVIVGYTLYVSKAGPNTDASYSETDHAPGDWFFKGSNDGITWTTLDVQKGYILYDNGRSVHFRFNNSVAYKFVEIRIEACTRNGPIKPRIQEMTITTADEASNTINVTLVAPYPDFNGGKGFLATDVDRLMRIKGYDFNWRVVKIKTVTDATHAIVVLKDDPFFEREAFIREFQLGYFSDTLGWPNFGCFFEDRLWLGGLANVPGLIAGSRPGNYSDFAQRTPINTVLDDSAIVQIFNTRKRSNLRWLSTDERGLIAGMGGGIFVVQPASTNDSALTARNIKARSSTERGVADSEPTKVDRQILSIANARRGVNEIAYVFEADGYKAPSMSLFSSHLGAKKFLEIQDQSEPYNLVWVRRDDGTLVCMTYYREEKVVGWHSFDFGGFVESFSVAPNAIAGEDKICMSIRRTLEDNTVARYIIMLTPFWNFGKTIDDCWYLDFALRYVGAPVSAIGNIPHLDKEAVIGVLADGVKVDGLQVVNGIIELPNPASNVLIGVKYERLAVRANLDAGVFEGTPQGKIKRQHEMIVRVWDSLYGQVGILDVEEPEDAETADRIKWEDIDYPENYASMDDPKLFTGLTKPTMMPPHFDRDSILCFRQMDPYPLNIIALYPRGKGSERQ